jgi:hypothetical protein
MSNENENLNAIRQIVREEMNRRNERIVFALVFIAGLGMLIGAAFISNAYWQSLLLNLGSSLVSFVFLFAIFQYFTDRQPGNVEQNLPPKLHKILDADVSNANGRPVATVDQPIPAETGRRKRRAPTLSEDDAAELTPR